MKVCILVVVVVVALVTPTHSQGAGQAPVLKTKQGHVSGVVEHSVKGKTFYSYYGIPYAKPPIGPLRFKDPEQAEKWSGVRDGTVMPEPCLQISLEPFVTDLKAEEKDYHGTEDCLYLNIFTPKPRDDPQNLPVMVWFHGGGFFSGGAKEYLPHVLLDQDIVLVVVQYRLGIFGFLSTEDVVMPGNLGLKDQTQALQWIHKNIDHFGGDEHQVTIFGESAGGASVVFQMLTPATKGLFSRVISQSGTALAPWAVTRTAAQTAKRVAQALSCPTEQGSQKMLTCLQVLDSRQIIYQTQDLFDWFIFPLLMAPRVDGIYLPAEPGQLIREGKFHKVDLMSGTTRDDGAFISLPIYAFNSVGTAIENNFSVAGPASLGFTHDIPDREELAREVYQYYLGGTQITTENAEQVTQMLGDTNFHAYQDLTAIYHASASDIKKTFSYEFDYKGQLSVENLFPTDIGSKEWVTHGDELFYLFPGGPLLSSPTLSLPQDLTTAEDLEMRDIITKLWTNFAITGHPTPDATLGFIWEPVTPNSFQHLSIAVNSKMMPDSRQKVRIFLSSLPIPTNQALHPYMVIPHTQGKDEL